MSSITLIGSISSARKLAQCRNITTLQQHFGNFLKINNLGLLAKQCIEFHQQSYYPMATQKESYQKKLQLQRVPQVTSDIGQKYEGGNPESDIFLILP